MARIGLEPVDGLIFFESHQRRVQLAQLVPLSGSVPVLGGFHPRNPLFFVRNPAKTGSWADIATTWASCAPSERAGGQDDRAGDPSLSG